MVLTYQEALNRFGSRYRIRKAVSEGEIRSIGRGLYSTSEDEYPLVAIAKRHPNGILTGQTTLYAHGLVTAPPPERIDSATKRGETKIHDLTVRQHFVPEEWLEIGRTTISMGGIDFPAYDLERMLLELMRSRNKLPHDLYKEAVLSFRNRSDKMDIYKLQDYAEAIPHGEAHLERAFGGGGVLMRLDDMRARYEREFGYSRLNATARVERTLSNRQFLARMESSHRDWIGKSAKEVVRRLPEFPRGLHQ